jgi:hypothetical protein
MRVKAIKHNSANYVKSPFLPQALEALKEMNNPEVKNKVDPPDP